MSSNQLEDELKDQPYEAMILITRGDPMPKKNYEKKLHPTYETSIRIKYGEKKLTTPHLVVKFFDQYRKLQEDLVKLGIGPDQQIRIDATFPPSHATSVFGLGMTEDQLQERCFLLNKWMQALFVQYHIFPIEAQKIISEFLSLNDNDAAIEANKEQILSLLRNKAQRDAAKASASSTVTSTTPVTTSTTPALTAANLERATTTTSTTAAATTEQQTTSKAPEPVSNKAGSVVSMAEGKELTSAELADYAQETIINHCLAVSVLRGDKSDPDAKGHAAYEAIIRFLTWDLTTFEKKENYSEQAYQQQTSLPPLSATKVFDGFRTFKSNLEKVGVFTRDGAAKAREFNELDSSRYNAVIIAADFPPTYRRSSLGLGLTEAQLQSRVVMLNYWLGQLFKAFASLPAAAQELLVEFFGIKLVEDAAAPSKEIYLQALQGSYEPPSKRASQPNSPHGEGDDKGKKSHSHRQGSLFSGFLSGNQKSEKDDAEKEKAAETPAAASSTSTAEDVIALSSEGRNSDTNINLAQMSSIAKENSVFGFLGVLVTAGEKVDKKGAVATTKHQGYETNLRLLPLEKVVYAEKEKIDEVAYLKQAQLPTVTITKSFDAYRTMRNNLEAKGVRCQDQNLHGSSAGLAMKGNVLLDATFPPTYRRSSLGLGLTENQLIERQALLNQFMSALLNKFSVLPAEAQEEVLNFLIIDDNPIEPQNKLILSILKRTYKPPHLQPAPKPAASSTTTTTTTTTTGKKGNNTTTSTTVTTSTMRSTSGPVGGDHHEHTDPSEKSTEGNGTAGTATNNAGSGDNCCVPGGACTIM